MEQAGGRETRRRLTTISPSAQHPCHRVSRRNDRVHFELNQVAPRSNPVVEQLAVVALHDLITTCQIVRYPGTDIAKPIGGEPPARAKAFVHRPRITVSE